MCRREGHERARLFRAGRIPNPTGSDSFSRPRQDLCGGGVEDLKLHFRLQMAEQGLRPGLPVSRVFHAASLTMDNRSRKR